VTGVAAIFIDAIFQLGRRGVITMRAGLEPVEWIALVVVLVLFVYGEGERALGRRWMPHVLERARELERSASLPNRLLAPLYAMSLIGAPGRVLARAWIGVALIVMAVLIVREFPEPWRGIVDLSVAAALTWGFVRGAMNYVRESRKRAARV
jgi:hypothetical protein